MLLASYIVQTGMFYMFTYGHPSRY